MPKSQKIFTILENSLIVLHGLILILVIGQDNIQLPAFLEVVGRMHPLLLHFPIVMLFLAALLFWFPDSLGVNSKVAMKWLLLSALFFTGVTVLAGLFLSVEDGYVKEDFENLNARDRLRVRQFQMSRSRTLADAMIINFCVKKRVVAL